MTYAPLQHPNGEPFVAEVTYYLVKGALVPSASVRVTDALPELAGDVGFEAVGLLAALMASCTANGAVGPSAAQAAAALGKPVLPVRLRLLRLARRYWRGQPVLRVIRRASGLETFHPSPVVLGRREALPPQAATPPGVAPAGYERVREATRAAYARPVDEVERELRSLHGWAHPDEREALAIATAKPPTDLDERWAVERLAREKVDYGLSIKLVREFGAERCLNQLRWLPYRKGTIKNRPRYLVWAIQNDLSGPGAQSDEGNATA